MPITIYKRHSWRQRFYRLDGLPVSFGVFIGRCNYLGRFVSPGYGCGFELFCFPCRSRLFGRFSPLRFFRGLFDFHIGFVRGRYGHFFRLDTTGVHSPLPEWTFYIGGIGFGGRVPKFLYNWLDRRSMTKWVDGYPDDNDRQ